MSSHIAIDQASRRPYAQAGADQATLIEDPGGRGCYLIAGSSALTVDHSTLDRSIDGGTTWERVADQLPTSTTVTDPECLSAGTTRYRATAVSTLPSSAVSIGELNVQDDRSMYLSGGDATVARLHYNPDTTITPSLVYQEEHYFSGQKKPTLIEGTATSLIIQASATILPDRVTSIGTDVASNLNALITLASTPGLKLYRDGRGRRVFGRLYNMQISDHTDGVSSVSFTLKEMDH